MPNSSRICVDANLVVKLVALPSDEVVRNLWNRWIAAGATLHAPLLLRYEVVNALYRTSLANTRSVDAARRALRASVSLPITLHTDEDLHLSAIEFATRFNLPATYDAHYLALAAKLGTEFWTADPRPANAVQSQLAWVQLAG